MPLTEQLKEEVFRLDTGERTKLVKELLKSLEPDSTGDAILSSWISEAHSRYVSWKKGNVTTVSEEEANERIKKRLQ